MLSSSVSRLRSSSSRICRLSQSRPSTLGIRSFASGKSLDDFGPRHIGPREDDLNEMLKVVGFESLDKLVDSIVPSEIRSNGEELNGVPVGATESDAMNELKGMAQENVVLDSMIGQGYYGTKVPFPILRNLIENPAWYTAYTPYQAEISQGRLEMLLNFQTMVSSLTGLEIANCSLLDEGSAAAEGMNMCYANARQKKSKFFVSADCHPQTIGCVQTRGDSMGIEVVVGNPNDLISGEKDVKEYCGALVQYPNTYGSFGGDHSALADLLHENKTKLVVATDLMACTMVTPPGEFGADIVVGSAQRFGVPMFYGGPHAGWMSTKDELKRLMPGRLIGVSVDSQGNRALRMALQTREQFIRREKATSNICTAQALLANVAAAYGIYHGPEGLKRIAQSIHDNARGVARGAQIAGFQMLEQSDNFFDTLTFTCDDSSVVVQKCVENGINIRAIDEKTFGLSIDETHDKHVVGRLFDAFSSVTGKSSNEMMQAFEAEPEEVNTMANPRTSEFMEHPIFNKYHSETKLLRYLTTLERKDITLRESMIPLGSCTMKLNSASELMPVSWPEFSNLHPFCPPEQAVGYKKMIESLNGWLASLTGFAAVSTQPNAGATGEYAGLICIKKYHENNGEGHRNICLIPNSAHGTNPASAVLCGMKVVGIKNDSEGNIDVADFKKKVEKHSKNLAAMMVTYPSTYGKYEQGVEQLIELVHNHGGQVYMDGANMNAQLGLTSPGFIGADVCHLNLHKTFAIPHGGGGPGVGSIGVKEHLAPFLPGHVVQPQGGEGKNTVPKLDGQVAAAPFGSAGVLPISWMFIRMMGKEGMEKTSKIAMLNANYIAKKLEKSYKILFRGHNGQCAHEFILDLSYLKKYGLTETDVAKRLADYGFHSPTTSWPVHYSLMVEPTESESKEECDRLIEAFLSIHDEIQEVIDGKVDQENNVLVNAPHTSEMIASDDWPYPYSRKKAAFPVPSIDNSSKIWPSVSRVDNAAGDRNLICSCPSVEEFE